MDERTPLLEVQNIKKHFPIRKGLFKRTMGHIRAVDGVSFNVQQGETLGLVGESGCGKSTLGRVILRLVEPTSGEIYLDGRNVCTMDAHSIRECRKEIQIIFQDPYASLNPRMIVGDIVGEPMEIFKMCKPQERRDKVLELLRLVGLDEYSYSRYAHEFSGGQRQRICIARALSVNPKLVVCDEPVSALDVSVRSQVLNLMSSLQKQMGLAYLFISHDLSVVKHICDRVAVMYLGEIVELAERDALFDSPLHPYTSALLSAIPIPDPEAKSKHIVLAGDVPSPANPPSGCRFHPRCPQAMEVCATINPRLTAMEDGHQVACLLHQGQSGQQ